MDSIGIHYNGAQADLVILQELEILRQEYEEALQQYEQAQNEVVQAANEQAQGQNRVPRNNAQQVPVVAQAVNQVQENLLYKRNTLLTNPLSCVWNWKEIKNNPSTLISGILLWPFGMVGYAFSLIYRIYIFVVMLVRTLKDTYAYHNEQSPELKEKMKISRLVLGASVKELGSALVGSVIPVLGYKIDEMIQSDQTIYDYYNHHFVTIWSKPEELKYVPIIPFFEEAKQEMQQYHDKVYMTSLDVALLDELFLVGLLNAFKKELELKQFQEIFFGKMGDIAEVEEKKTIEKEIKNSILQEIQNDQTFLGRMRLIPNQREINRQVNIEYCDRLRRLLATDAIQERINTKKAEVVSLHEASFSEKFQAWEENFKALQQSLSDEQISNFIFFKIVLNARENYDEDNFYKNETKETEVTQALSQLDKNAKEKIEKLFQAVQSYKEKLTTSDRNIYAFVTQKVLDS